MRKNKQLINRIFIGILTIALMSEFFYVPEIRADVVEKECQTADQLVEDDACIDATDTLLSDIDEDATIEAQMDDEEMSHVDNEEVNAMIQGTFSYLNGSDGYVLSKLLGSAGTTGGDWFALCANRSGKSDAYESYLSALEKYVSDKYKKNSYGLDRNKATEWHRITFAVLSCGGDPTKFGEDADGNPINLIADGTYNCKVGTPWKQGINGAIFALLTLDTNNYSVPKDATYTREDIISYILSKELASGGFALSGQSMDVDVTAMAVQALSPYYSSNAQVKACVDRCLGKLSSAQQKDGDFKSGGYANVESTAQVLTALSALSIDPLSDERFITSEGNTVLDGIRKYYVSSGGFCHTIESGANIVNGMATQQGLYSLIAYQRMKNGKTRLYDFSDVARDSSGENEGDDPDKKPEDKPGENPADEPGKDVDNQPEKKPEENPTKDEDKKSNKSKSGKKMKNLQQMKVKKKIKKGDETIKRVDAYIKEQELKKIIGTDKNIKVISEDLSGASVVAIFHGKDIRFAKDFVFLTTMDSLYKDEMNELADSPVIFSFVNDNEFPGDFLLEMTVDLEDGDYLLCRYDEELMRAVFVQKVTVKDGKMKWIAKENGNYLVAKRVKDKSLLPKEENDLSEKELENTVKEDVSLENVDETLSQENGLMKENRTLPINIKKYLGGILVIMAGVLVLALAFIATIILRKKK